MSQPSMSQRLDAARKANREKDAFIASLPAAMRVLPPIAAEALATLFEEAYAPSRPATDDLGTHVHDKGDGWHIPRSNHAAAAELKRWQAEQRRWATRIMGDEGRKNEAGHVGRIEELIYGKASSHTPLREVS